MPIDSVLVDTRGGKDRRSKVSVHGAVAVESRVPELPPLGMPTRRFYLQGLLGSGGLGSGTTDLRVDGSVTPQTFFVGSSPDRDRYIVQLVLVIADSSVNPNDFGGVSALANGFDLVTRQQGADTVIVNKAKTSAQLMTYSPVVGFGNATTYNELSNWTGNQDAHIVTFRFDHILPGPLPGIRIAAGSTDRLIATVNDDLTGLTEFRVRVFGLSHAA